MQQTKPSGPSSLSNSRLPSLDGWRAISILIVLGAHSHHVAHYPVVLNPIFDRLLTGDLGVRCFFIISGLLITWLMMVEDEAEGRINLWHFYIRRMLRIFPVYFTFLAVIAGLAWFTPFKQSVTEWLTNLTFTTNFIPGPWATGHLWSLAVEEQFYLIWPVIFVASGAGRRPLLSLRILILPLLIAPVWRAMTGAHLYPASLARAFTLFSFGNYFDSLAVGCLCAILLRRHRAALTAALCSQPKSIFTIGLVLIAVPRLFGPLHVPGVLATASGHSIQAAGLALLLMQSIIQPGLFFYRALNWKVVCHIGVLSYSIYIWQQIFCAPPGEWGLPSVWWMSFPGWMLSAIVVAHLSYYGLEQPFFRLRSHFRSRSEQKSVVEKF